VGIGVFLSLRGGGPAVDGVELQLALKHTDC
jgi:hypothetical protein